MSLFVASFLALTLQPQDPLAPIREGKIQCRGPNVAARTCRAMAHYTRTETGYLNTTVMLFSADPLTTAEMTIPVTLKDDTVCGTITRRSVVTARFVRLGAPAPEIQAAAGRALLANLYESQGIFDAEMCTHYRDEGETLRAEIWVGGVLRSDLGDSLIWVAPTDGYRIGASACPCSRKPRQ